MNYPTYHEVEQGNMEVKMIEQISQYIGHKDQ